MERPPCRGKDRPRIWCQETSGWLEAAAGAGRARAGLGREGPGRPVWTWPGS